MMVQDGWLLPKVPGIETDAYSRGWRSVQALDSFSMSRKLDAAGWHLFFVAGQVTTVAFGLGGERSVHKAVERIAAKVRALALNCLELTQIARKHFLGVPYIAISAHSYHIQPGWQLQNANERRRSQPDPTMQGKA
jgi:hypothetical protein